MALPWLAPGAAAGAASASLPAWAQDRTVRFILPNATGSGVDAITRAVQEAKGVQLVFVQLSEDTYETRRVRVTPADNAMVAIAADVRPGERVVTTGSFLLKTWKNTSGSDPTPLAATSFGAKINWIDLAQAV